MNELSKAAAALGAIGGKSTSPAKQAASRENGRKHVANMQCAFCYPREQGTHGEVKREWSPEWSQFIPVCRKHALADGMDKDGINAPYTAQDGIINDD